MANIASSSSSAPSSESPKKYASSSSSSPSSEPPKKYDVFINFRGDTRNIFTRHLHDALYRHKIETYIDYRIEKGDEVWPALVEAVENSLLFLVIFSEHYASSTWCLKELDRILEVTQGRKRRVIPVFYYIKPTDVRKQTARSYEEAFSKYENSNHGYQVGRWKAALAKTADLGGFESSAYSGDEVALIKDIVKCVLGKLDPLYQSSYLDGLFGIQEQIAQVETLLCNELQDVRFIGIWGMGGIGKTTIAAELFKKLCSKFESFYFLRNVRENSEKQDIMDLKKKLFFKLLKDKEYCVGMPDEITTYDKKRLGKKKVFIVLDDVKDPEQLQELVGEHKWFGPGSRVIITSRDKQVFAKLTNEIYPVRALKFQDALQLFYLKAFKNDCLDEEFEELSREVVAYAKGLPLALIVLGSMLCGKGKDKWKSQLEKLKKMPCLEVQKILKLSYEELDYEEKNMFLDIACILKGRRVEVIKNLFDAWGYSTEIELDRLQDRALITISNKVVSMHDLIQEMGKEIVREKSLRDPGQRSHLWDPKDIYQVIKYNKGSEYVEAISLDASKIEELELSPRAFDKMPQLKFLEIYSSKEHYLYLPQGTLESLPNELRYLRWEKCPLKSLPSTFSPEKLVELDMPRSKMRTMWDGVQNLTNLKEMHLSDSEYLMELPDFSKASNLKNVDLNGCSSLSKIHPSILSLQNLKQLLLSSCHALTSLKSDVHLKSLDVLHLAKCSRLKEISITAENITYLNLQGTGIDSLPSCIRRMSKLSSFPLRRCKNLKNIPINLFDGLQSLCWMSLGGCPKLQCLPELPPSLRELYVDGCPSLETVTSVAARMTTFENCNNLSEHSAKAIQANLMVHINRSISRLETGNPDRSGYISVKYPGSRVPEWFKYRTTHHPITIDLSSAPPSMDWGLIFCICHGPTPNHITIRCRLRIFHVQTVGQGNDNDADENYRDDALQYFPLLGYGPHETFSPSTDLTSDHVEICYNEHICHEIHQSIQKSRASSNSKIELILEVFSPDVDDLVGLIKECGVYPTYESEYQNFMKQMGLESQASASKIPGDEFKGSIYPSHSTATWKNRTQGFKEIINL